MNLNTRSVTSLLLVSLAFIVFVSCGSGRSVKRTAASVRAEREVSVVDTQRSVQAVVVTAADTSSEAEAKVTVELDTLILNWDTIGTHVVLSSAIRSRMTSQLMERNASAKAIESMLSHGESVHIEAAVATDSIDAVEESGQQPSASGDKKAGTGGMALAFVLFLFIVMAIAAVVSLLLTLAYRIVKRYRDGRLY